MSVILEYNGLTLTPANGYIVNTGAGFNGIDGMRVSEAVTTGRDGGNVFARRDNMRTIILTGTVFGNTVEEFFNNKAALLDAFWRDSDSDLIITLWNNQTKQIRALCIEEPTITYDLATHTTARFRITLRCPFPYFSSVDLQSITLYLGSIIGFDFPFDFPFDITVDSSQNTGAIVNDGVPNVAYPKIRINGNLGLTNPTITNLTTGKSLQLATNTIIQDTYVDIEMTSSGLSVLFNGTANYYDKVIGELSPLVAGSNVFIFTAATQVNVANAVIEFRSPSRSM